MKKIIGFIGSSDSLCTQQMYGFVYDLAFRLAQRGYSIVCGGLGGVMEAAAKGVTDAQNTQANSICIIPQASAHHANQYCHYVIPTGMDRARNMLIINTAHLLVAIGGGAGTLSEIALAWQQNKTSIAITAFPGWAQKLAGQTLDSKNQARIIPASTIQQALELIEKYMHDQLGNNGL